MTATMPAAYFGMNLSSGLEDIPGVFWPMVQFSLLTGGLGEWVLAVVTQGGGRFVLGGSGACGAGAWGGVSDVGQWRRGGVWVGARERWGASLLRVPADCCRVGRPGHQTAPLQMQGLGGATRLGARAVQPMHRLQVALLATNRAEQTCRSCALPAATAATGAGLMYGYYRFGPKRRYKARLRDMRSLR